MKASEFFALPPSLAVFAAYFPADALPWEWLKQIGPALASLGPPPPASGRPLGLHIAGPVWIHPSVKLPAQGTLIGPAWIGPETELRPGVYFRGNVIAGAGCVLGNSCEFKNSLLMDGVEVPHFSYVGDSILGNGAHLGAGAICSNLRLDQKAIKVRVADKVFETGLRKFGAIIGERAEVGCNAVLNPGVLLGRRSLVMPAMTFSGFLPPATIAHSRSEVKLLPRMD